MSEKDNGGYAYPRKLPKIELPPDATIRVIKEYAGMTLRDYFAGQAMIGYSTRENRKGMKAEAIERDIHFPPEKVDETIAQACYLMADAMLKERTK